MILDADYDPVRLAPLQRLLNSTSRREAERVAKEIAMTGDDLAAFATLARVGALAPYTYAVHFADRVPSHLLPKEGVLGPDLRPGPLEGEAAKSVRKLFQLYEERRIFAAHLLYTPDHLYWDLLYFDQRDVQEINNHWHGGPHLHYASSKFHQESLETIWERVRSGETAFLRPIHVRFDYRVDCPE